MACCNSLCDISRRCWPIGFNLRAPVGAFVDPLRADSLSFSSRTLSWDEIQRRWRHSNLSCDTRINYRLPSTSKNSVRAVAMTTTAEDARCPSPTFLHATNHKHKNYLFKNTKKLQLWSLTWSSSRGLFMRLVSSGVKWERSPLRLSLNVASCICDETKTRL